MKKVDFLIVGQGLAGTTLAFEMLKEKLSFHILSSPVKSKASNVAAGMVNPLVFKRLTKSWMVDELLPVMRGTFTSCEKILGEQLLFEKDILKPLSAQEKLLWQERKESPDFSKYIRKIEDVSSVKNVAEADGYGIVTHTGYLNLVRFLMLAENYFQSQNLLTKADFIFQRINPKDEFFTIGDIRANKIVFCEGYHLSGNPFFDFVKLNPVKGEVIQILSSELQEEYILNKGVFVLPVGNHRFKVGSTYEWEDLSETPTEKGKQSISERLDKLIRINYSVENHWAGIRPAVVDRRPVLGQHPELNKLYIFNGLGTKGVMLAPFFAKQMLKILNQKNYVPLHEVDVARFYW